MTMTATATTALTWGTYLRISDDAEDTGRGVNRQDDDTSEAVTRRGGTVGKVYRENDTSAYRKKRVQRIDPEGTPYFVYRVIRPKWQKALSDLRNGVIDALMVWDFDRLARDPRDLEDAIEVVTFYGKRIEDAAGSLDLMTDGGQMMARMLVAHANKSSADTARRVSRAHKELAENGASIGGWRTFGWQADKLTLDKVESKLATTAIADVIAGDATPRQIADRWNEAGIKTVRGGKWNRTSVVQYLRNPRLMGKREYMDLMYDGQWKSLIDADTYDRLQVAITPAVKGSRPNARKYALSGLLRCAICGSSLMGATSGGRFSYSCDGRRTGHDHKVGANGERTDRLVSEVVLREMEDSIIATPEAEFGGEDRLAEIKGEKKEALAKMKAKTLSAGMAMAMVEMLEAEEAELKAERATWIRKSSGPSTKRVTREAFEAMSADDQREVLSVWIKSVVVSPATQGRQFDPHRFEIVWTE